MAQQSRRSALNHAVKEKRYRICLGSDARLILAIMHRELWGGDKSICTISDLTGLNHLSMTIYAVTGSTDAISALEDLSRIYASREGIEHVPLELDKLVDESSITDFLSNGGTINLHPFKYPKVAENAVSGFAYRFPDYSLSTSNTPPFYVENTLRALQIRIPTQSVAA